MLARQDGKEMTERREIAEVELMQKQINEKTDGRANENGHAPSGPEVARRFNLLLAKFLRADGEPWTGAEIEGATDHRVTSSYVSALKHGKFKRPGILQLELIAEVMGFPFELWRVEPELWDEIPGGCPPQPLDETLALDAHERAVVAVMRSMDNQRKDAVLAMVRQMEVL